MPARQGRAGFGHASAPRLDSPQPPTRRHLAQSPRAGRQHNVFEHRAELEWERVYPEKASAMLVPPVERRNEDASMLISEEWRDGLRAQLR